MKVRRLDDSFYIVSYNGDLFRAFHSDLGKTPFVSLQDIESAGRKYSYFTYKLSDDGGRLDVRVIDTKVIPKELKDSASVQKLLTKNSKNPGLFGDEGQFTKEKWWQSNKRLHGSVNSRVRRVSLIILWMVISRPLKRSVGLLTKEEYQQKGEDVHVDR
jgi:hypothetical protein